MEDGDASVLFDYLFSYGCVGRGGDPEYKKEKKKKRDQTKHRPAGKFIVNVPFFFFLFLSFVLFYFIFFPVFPFQNEGKWFVSQNDFKTISGSVEQHAVRDDDKAYDEDYKVVVLVEA